MSEIANCKCCGAVGKVDRFRSIKWYCRCENNSCLVYGPCRKTEKEAISAWNALMSGAPAPHEQPKEPAAGTVRVRIPVRFDKDEDPYIRGFWATCNEEWCDDNQEDGELIAYITADIPLPQPQEIVGRVE